jgi:hypothetical protein
MKRKYSIVSNVTITLHTNVEADTESEAVEIANSINAAFSKARVTSLAVAFTNAETGLDYVKIYSGALIGEIDATVDEDSIVEITSE